METTKLMFPWLDLIERPAFCVQNRKVTAINTAARHYNIPIGAKISQLITAHHAYNAYHGGHLFLSVTLNGLTCDAYVNRISGCDIFILQTCDAQLQALALAAQHLRIPLGNLMIALKPLLSKHESNCTVNQQCRGNVNRALFQLMRIISNMSEANRKRIIPQYHCRTINLTAVFWDLIEKATEYFSKTGMQIAYSGPTSPIFSYATQESLEKAIYNLLSNALKFSPANSTIYVKLSRNKNTLSFSVCNTYRSLNKASNCWSCYRREASIENREYGLGLGLTLVCKAASLHGGTVLIDHPKSDQIRVTMTIAIHNTPPKETCTPPITMGDYAGGYDKGLLEFSELLPSTFFRQID